MLAVLQAGGAGSRMDVLTRERAKPVLPFGGTFRLIDFALSTVAAAGVPDVWVSVQFQASSLDLYLAGGRPWDLDRTRGGYRRMVPQEGSGPATVAGFANGNADDLYRIAGDIAVHAPRTVVVLSCDHVIDLDLAAVLEQHHERGAECTVVTAEVGVREAQHNMVVRAGRDGVVTSVDYKPDRVPDTGLVATEVFVYDAAVLLEQLEVLRRELAPAASDPGDTGLGDFGEHLLPRLVARGRTHVAPVTGYWRDVGRPESFLMAHRDLLAGRIGVFDHPERPVLSHPSEGPPGIVAEGSTVVDSMVGPRSVVRGTVRRSVLGPRVEVQAGAVVEDCVLFGDTVVEAGARVATAVVDEGVTVGRDAVVGRLHGRGAVPGDAVTLIGRDCRVRRGADLPAGTRMEPGSSS